MAGIPNHPKWWWFVALFYPHWTIFVLNQPMTTGDLPPDPPSKSVTTERRPATRHAHVAVEGHCLGSFLSPLKRWGNPKIIHFSCHVLLRKNWVLQF
jgi:hypothetical protein